jgi:hypothetical protein
MGWVKLNAVQFLNEKYKQNKVRARGQGHCLMCKITFEKKNSFLITASVHEKIDLQLKLSYMRQFSVLLGFNLLQQEYVFFMDIKYLVIYHANFESGISKKNRFVRLF